MCYFLCSVLFEFVSCVSFCFCLLFVVFRFDCVCYCVPFCLCYLLCSLSFVFVKLLVVVFRTVCVC